MSRLWKLMRGGAKSQTILGNGALIGILFAFAESDLFQQLVVNNPSMAAYAPIIIAVLNILQRFRTKEAIEDKVE